MKIDKSRGGRIVHLKLPSFARRINNLPPLHKHIKSWQPMPCAIELKRKYNQEMITKKVKFAYIFQHVSILLKCYCLSVKFGWAAARSLLR